MMRIAILLLLLIFFLCAFPYHSHLIAIVISAHALFIKLTQISLRVPLSLYQSLNSQSLFSFHLTGLLPPPACRHGGPRGRAGQEARAGGGRGRGRWGVTGERGVGRSSVLGV